jgi:hypothetical protein
MLSRFFVRSRKTYGLPLAEGAAHAYDEARREGLVLARIAERHPLGAHAFFADSLLRLGAVLGRPSGQSEHVPLSREKVATLAPTRDLSGLNSETEPRIGDLRVPPAELKRYLAWARTVQ